ncbi:MAG: tRNA 2-thiocytidine(32) synthetase TtcA [Bryobacter sp.]
MDVQKLVQRKVGEAIARFKMIREGDRVAVGVSGGKDSVTLLEALLQLQKKAPISFEVLAFTIEQGKFLAPILPYGAWLKERGIAWHYFEDAPSLQMLEDEPEHGCDKCSRFRRRAVYDVGKRLGANVIALGHTADDFCESFLRNAMFTGALSALPPVTYSREKDFRLIRPLVYVQEAWTTAYAQGLGCPVVPCGCSQKTGTVRRGIRDFFAELEQEHPNLKETLLGAMGNIKVQRLLDQRYFDPDAHDEDSAANKSTNSFVVIGQEA